MSISKGFAGALLALVAGASGAHAHHSVQAQFDMGKVVVLKGVMTRVDWINPHTYLYIDVKNAAGTVDNWAIETLNPSVLRRAGLRSKEVFKVGETYTLTARPSRNGSRTALLKIVEFADGTKIGLGAGVPGEE